MPRYELLHEEPDVLEPVSEREALLTELHALKLRWRLPVIDRAPVQPTAEELPTWMQAWEAVGLIACTGEGQHRFTGLVAVIERETFARMQAIRARLIAIDSATEERILGAIVRGFDRATGVAA